MVVENKGKTKKGIVWISTCTTSRHPNWHTPGPYWHYHLSQLNKAISVCIPDSIGSMKTSIHFQNIFPLDCAGRLTIFSRNRDKGRSIKNSLNHACPRSTNKSIIKFKIHSISKSTLDKSLNTLRRIFN